MKGLRAKEGLALAISCLTATLFLSARAIAQDPDVNVITWQNDLGRTGQNLDEVKLVKSALQSTTNPFGQLCNIQLDGQVYAQPLVVSDVNFNGGTTTYASVVYVVTENDTVYAINGTALGTSPSSCNATTAGQILKSTPLQTYTIGGVPTTLYQVDCRLLARWMELA